MASTIKAPTGFRSTARCVPTVKRADVQVCFLGCRRFVRLVALAVRALMRSDLQVCGASMKELRDRIGSVNNTKKITDAMKLVAAAKVRRAQEAVVNGRPFSENLVKVSRLGPQSGYNPNRNCYASTYWGLNSPIVMMGHEGPTVRNDRDGASAVAAFSSQHVKCLCYACDGLLGCDGHGFCCRQHHRVPAP